ncbi:hypothetical protein GCM10028784_11690 [Myceligenerans cantabricum]
MLLTAGRLLGRHWPALFTLAFLGVALRGAAFWGAIELSRWNAFGAHVLLLLMPLGILVPVVVMLRVCSPSLPHLARPRHDGIRPGLSGSGSGWGAASAAAPSSPYGEPVADGRPRGRLSDVALSVLVPFLTVYVVEGTADSDHARWLNDTAAAELAGTDAFTGDLDFTARLGLLTGWTLLGVVLALLVLRWLLGVLERKTHFLALALLGVALEVFWTVQTAYDSERLASSLWITLQERALVHWGVGTYASVTEDGQGATAAEVAGTVVEGAGTVAESLDEVLVAPLGWLAIGAVVLGRQLMAPPSTEHRWLDQTSMPGALRRMLAAITQEVRDRFSALWQGLKMIVRGGVGTMLVFCVAYLVVMRAPLAVGWVVRTITGPVETRLWTYVISPWELAAGTAISLALAGALIAAAVDVMVSRGMVVDAEPENEISDGEGAIPGTSIA